MMASDSDSYGSEGGLKAKEVVIKKRGGKKRNKNGEMESQATFNNNSADEMDDIMDDVSEATYTGDLMYQEQKIEEDRNVAPERVEIPDFIVNETSSTYGTSNDKSESEGQIKSSLAKKSAGGSLAKPRDSSPKKGVQKISGTVKSVYKPMRRREYSPPMINEYDPNEDNAKTRAKKRQQVIQKREKSVEPIDKSLYPEHPTPWKGRPSEFFLVHAPRRAGQEKVLNNSQKEFILVYYEDSVVDHISLMEFLYKQAKGAEDQIRFAKDANERAANSIIARGKKNTKRNRAPKPVYEVQHTNQNVGGYFKDGVHKPISFESILEEEGNWNIDYKQYENTGNNISELRRQIDSISTTAYNYANETQTTQEQHSRYASQSVGFCSHCHNHASQSGVTMDVSTATVYNETEIQRQNILRQICEAKKRQARMEAEEARRLHDEARRLSEQANILELEAQRPLLEAKKLELEARALEAQFNRTPQHMAGARGHVEPSVVAIEEARIMQQRAQVASRRAHLLQEASRTQQEIKRLQETAGALQQRTMQPRTEARKTISEDMRPLYAALEGKTSNVQIKDGMVFVPSQNSIAAKEAREQARAATAPRKLVTAAKKKVVPIYEEHNYSDGEASDGEQIRPKDPYLAAASREYEAAKEAFELAQKQQEDAQRKQDERVKKQQDEIAQAQERTQKYFEEEKKKQEEEKKSSVKKPKDWKKVAEQEKTATECDRLLNAFNVYCKRLRTDSASLAERFGNRTEIFEFLGPILSGQILKDFDESQRHVNFSPYFLTDNFSNGHQEYMHKWRHLFLYESYSFMMNSRWSKFTGNDIDLKNQLMRQSQEKSMCWKGYLQYSKMVGKLCTIKLFKEPPNAYSYTGKDKNYSKIYDEPDRHEGEGFDLTHCREDDLIVISKFRINLEGQGDIKMVSGGTKFLREVLSKPGVVFGYVQRCNTKVDNYVELLLDGKHAKTFSSSEDDNGDVVFTRYCYFFESILTCIREFRALKALEFTRFSPILAYPSLSLEYKDEMLATYCGAVEHAFGELDEAPDLCPKTYETDEQKQMTQMNNYLIKNHNKFNKSQAKVLEQIIEMPKDDILLIQGPPGTGKTHTIIGIISMLMSTRIASSKSKIMVCAPSNAAIDQIVARIVERGLIGLKGLKDQNDAKKDDNQTSDDEDEYELPDLTQQLIRITAAEYNTESVIKKHTLEQRIIKKLCIEKFGDLKKCIKEVKEMISSMNDYDSWDDNADFPYVSKSKYNSYCKTVRNSYLKTVKEWGDQNMSRPQQLQMMESQLKIHTVELNEFKTGGNIHQGNVEWKEAEKAIINDANIICCTLSMAGSAKLDTFANQFEYLIVDEACQSTEPSTLIPFRLCPKRVILVGDQKQLPATTFSGNSTETGYCRSLFERLLDAGFDKTMLTIQFRMHPLIRAFPSETFYGGAITDHPSIGLRSAPMQISNLASVFTNRMIFFDIQNSEEIYDNKSKCNYEEADFTRTLIDFIARKSSLQGTLKYIQGKIGVISPYKAQVRQLYTRLEKLCSDQACPISETIEVNTVDAFQGSEKDIIIFNCVRSNNEPIVQKSLGFLLDERRLNVAITRPKYFLMIVGNAKTLKKSEVWEGMINYCEKQGRFITVPGRANFDNLSDFKKCVLPQFMD